MGAAACAACRGAGMVEGVPCSACGGPPLSAPGTFGKFELNREVGRGSMGVVFDARDTTLDRRVALKVLFVSRSEDPREALRRWQRFMQEARLTAGVAKHPGVVTLYEAGVHEGRRYLAMEYVAGEPLGRWRPGRAERDQVRVLRDAALAVHHAHEHGIIHRDLKPANVLVQAGGRPVVTDFGLATTEERGAGGLTPSDVVVGSPAYMSPEQARGDRDAGRATDIYALGVMLYETVAGRLPFEGRTAVETLSKVMDGTKVPPSRARAGALADAALDAVCLRAMALDPARRHPTALAFADDLAAWLEDRAPARRPRLLTAAVLGALLGGGIVFALHLGLRPAVADPAPSLPPPVAVPLSAFVETTDAKHNSAGPTLLDFRSPTTFEAAVRVPETAEYRIVVTADGDAAKGERAAFAVLCDGAVVGGSTLRKDGPADYEVRAVLPRGERRLGLSFTNDYYDEAAREDRNLRVLGVALYRVP
jgi:predicted Ser/Thr protein kinase